MKPTKVKEMVWPQDDYTNKIHFAMKYMFSSQPHLTFTVSQMREHLQRGFKWLVTDNDRQSILLDKIISTGIRKLIQNNLVVLVTSKVSTERQWQHRKGAEVGSHTNITSDDDVAHTTDALKAIKGRAINARALWKLNHQEEQKAA
jgi:hypothetical protein